MHNLPNARKSCERRKWVQVWPGFRLIWPNWRVPWVFSVTKLLKSCKLHSIWMQHCVRDCESCRREKRRLTTSYSTRVWDDWQLQGRNACTRGIHLQLPVRGSRWRRPRTRWKTRRRAGTMRHANPRCWRAARPIRKRRRADTSAVIEEC